MAVAAPDDLPPLDDLSLRIVEDFEKAWESGRPEIVPHLEQHPDRPLRLLLELVAIDLENRVKRGEQALAEEYEARFPELAADAASVAELYRSFERCRRNAGSQSTVEEDVFRTIPMSSSAKEPESPFPFLSPPTAPGSIGTLAHYTIVRSVGQGAFGTVFEAFDEKLHRRVAIKMLSSPELAATSPPRKRFLREARSMAAISHENVVRVYAVEEQPIPYLVMEFVDGGTLQDRMDAEGPLSVPEIVNISRQVAAALAAAHEIGLIHRDIKPSNVLLERGPGRVVKLTDFGLARAFDDASMTRTGTVVGTPMYMSPEQAVGSTVDSRTDLFSLGSLMYVMTSGRLPFRAPSTIAVLKRLVDETPRPIPEIIPETPRWLVDLIARLHAKKPEERIQNAREVEGLLAKVQTDGAVTVEQAAGPGAVTPAGTAPHPLGWIAAAVVLAALAGAAVLFRGAADPGAISAVPRPPSQPPSTGTASAVATATPSTPVPPPAVAPFDAEQARKHQEAWAKHLGIPVETTNSIGQTLVVIPPGKFRMGAGASTEWGERQKEVSVTLSKPFLIAQTEVTQAQWRAVMGTEPWNHFNKTGRNGDDYAVTAITWKEAVEFCRLLTADERAAGRLLPDQEYRLPTEAEWEYACRAGTTTRWSFGDDERELDTYAWYGGGWDDGQKKVMLGGNHDDAPYPQLVRQKLPNPWELYDMHGNAAEWCGDSMERYPPEMATDPVGAAAVGLRVNRGGDWVSPAANTCSVRRSPWFAETTVNNAFGLRVVCTVSMSKAAPHVVGTSTAASDTASVPAPPPAVAPFDAERAKKHQEAWAKHLGIPVETTNSIGQTLVLIPPGRFRMGDGEIHLPVTITKPFQIGQTEVTQGQWRKVMGSEPWQVYKKFGKNGDDYAVTAITWDEAVEFCDFLTQSERAGGGIRADQEYRLPTEAEWEYACRAGTVTRWSFGNDESLLDGYGWYGGGFDQAKKAPIPGGNTFDAPYPQRVRQKLPNPWRLYDVHGNAAEWCLDSFEQYPAGMAADPIGPHENSLRVMRSGDWVSTAAESRSAHRVSMFQRSFVTAGCGFRVVLTLVATSGTPSIGGAGSPAGNTPQVEE